jgi:hypothetical protein
LGKKLKIIARGGGFTIRIGDGCLRDLWPRVAIPEQLTCSARMLPIAIREP